MVTRTILPVVNDAISTRVPSQYTAESVAKPSSSTTEATDVLGPSWALMSDDDNLIRTRRSSLSSGELLGTEPSYSYLKPPGFDLFDITPRIFSCEYRTTQIVWTYMVSSFKICKLFCVSYSD